jgi:hypothetical protein
MRLPFAAACLALFTAAALQQDPDGAQRFHTTRASGAAPRLPSDARAFTFAIFGDRTGGPARGIEVLREAVRDVNLFGPDLVMTVGDLVQGYNETPQWLVQANEYKLAMQALDCPWFPVAGNHDIYWRGGAAVPPEEHEADFEATFGPLWYAFEHQDTWFVALHSDEAHPETGERNFDKPECQRMGAAQFEFLRGALERARGAARVFVFLHHPRWLGLNYGDDWERVHRLLAEAGNVKAVFAGHIHRMRFDGERDGIEYFALATVGGEQSGIAPRAGYLHEFHLVTVRGDDIDVVAVPVGAALDARAVTGRVSDDAAAAARGLAPEFESRIALDGAGGASGELIAVLRNRSAAELELELSTRSADARWSLTPRSMRLELSAGQERRVKLQASRPQGSFDRAFRPAELVLNAHYVTPDLRVALPERVRELPLDRASLPMPAAPDVERVLVLDGTGDCLAVPHEVLELPDGPFTLEGWLCATEFRPRQGFVNKTESSEFGLFVDAGVPSFTAHLGGRYVAARAPDALLTPGRWHHVAGAFDGSEVRLYVDGQPVAASPGAGARTSAPIPLIIGADVSGDGASNSHFSGAIDEVRLSTGARYAASQPFQPQRRFTPDAQTILLLHMDADSGPWIADASPQRAHAQRRGDAHTAALSEFETRIAR